MSGKDNLADVFTKPLPAPQFLFFHFKLQVDSSPRRLKGDTEKAQGVASGSTEVMNSTHHFFNIRISS